MRQCIAFQSIAFLGTALVLAGPDRELLGQHEYKPSRTLIRDGEYEKAVALLKRRIEADPKDSEWVAQLGIAQARLGRADEAIASLRRAIEMGAPPERFVAEARNLLEPLRKAPEFRQWLAGQPRGIIHGPMLGDLTDRGVRVWVRTADEATLRVTASPGSRSDETLTSEPAAAAADSDFVAVLTLKDLKPETAYRYRVEIRTDGRWQPGPAGEFRTFPSPGSPAEFTIAFGGGAGYVPENERMWSTIAKFDPAALLLLGDNVYIDMPEDRSMQRFCYYRRHSQPEFRRLVRNRPVYTIWDDHDFGTNDCWGGPEVAEPAWKPRVWEVFRQNWANPGYGGGSERPGCWYDFQIGDVHFIMLDGRYYRENPRRTEPTMLGPHQKKWLKETLKGSKATFKVLASPVPWDFRTKGQSRDTWNGFRDERREIFSFLAEQGIDGVVLISADRHRSDAWRIERPDGYDLYEFCSSRLTNQHVHPTMRDALFSYNKKQSFGLVTFDTTADDPTVTYRVATIDGETVHTLPLKLSRLSR